MSKKKHHHVHVIFPEGLWQNLVKISKSRKRSVTELLIDGAHHIIDKNKETT